MKSEDIARYVGGLEAEVERLRAAQPVAPNVGPVTRMDAATLFIDGDRYTSNEGSLIEFVERHERDVACGRAGLAFLDAEAADTTTEQKCQCDYPAGAAYGAEPASVYGCPQHGPGEDEPGYAWHRGIASSSDYSDWNRAAHAQGLRGDDLNARVPYRVTDHRVCD